MSDFRRSSCVVGVVAGAIVFLASCSGQAGTAVSEPSTTTVSEAVTSTTESAGPYTETSLRVTGSTDRVDFDVVIPHIEGGDQAVTAEFNESMRAALQDQIDGGSGESFTLRSQEYDVTHIGAKVVSGLLVTSWNADPPGAHPTPTVATVVINAEDATPITLADLFPDLDAGLRTLSEHCATLLPATAAGPEFDRTGIEPVEMNFANWLATPAGMEIHFDDYQVGPHAVGLVTVTVPWDVLGDVVDPQLADVVSS
ncbi:RsiV family protein [Rhodococcus tibetensis]|uniref:RsiV family protein n=1 Tax=Rhodococcus tibetensis TaxID=2965064 RepID=A0ABT1QFX0_9NOCA|nr:RsiV family protein [Rhodococcus sp. FXJ9.536]MCQ4121179.1 RsiV family protein [Rhodococcus sp. FXJ9.536]